MKFGEAYSTPMGGDPFGHNPGLMCARIVEALQTFQTRGLVRTVKRLAGELNDQVAWNRMIAAGLPAFLVVYEGGKFAQQPTTVDGMQFELQIVYSVICLAGSYEDRIVRLENTDAYQPGLDNLMRWATYHAGRVLIEEKSLSNARPVEYKYLDYSPERYAGVVVFNAAAAVDIYDHEDGIELESLGIVHTPKNVSQLFNADNTTPNTDDPTGYGVADLGDE